VAASVVVAKNTSIFAGFAVTPHGPCWKGVLCKSIPPVHGGVPAAGRRPGPERLPRAGRAGSARWPPAGPRPSPACPARAPWLGLLQAEGLIYVVCCLSRSGGPT
jgi:hypothetical protein